MANQRKLDSMLKSLSSILSLFTRQANRVARKFRITDSNRARICSTITPRRSSKQKQNLEEEGLWQRSILMGEKCQPPDFSGVIYYDPKGNQLDQLPLRSPRATPLHGYAVGRNMDSN